MIILHFLFILFAARTLVNNVINTLLHTMSYFFDLNHLHFCNLSPHDLEYLTFRNVGAQFCISTQLQHDGKETKITLHCTTISATGINTLSLVDHLLSPQVWFPDRQVSEEKVSQGDDRLLHQPHEANTKTRLGFSNIPMSKQASKLAWLPRPTCVSGCI